ncbi:nodulation protein NfeD [Bacteroidota bacterium]
MWQSMRMILAAPLVVLSVALPTWQQAPMESSATPEVFVARVQDAAITPVTADYLAEAIDAASQAQAACIIIELDTPGGLMESTRDIVKAILGSRVPVVVYVSPSGARAASAGVFITLASHVAAMAPATHIGAAHPVRMGGTPGPAPSDGTQESQESEQSTMDEKILNDATAWVRSLAELRGRNVDWAVKSVTESKSTPSTEAVELNVVDFIAIDFDDLLNQLDGRTIAAAGDTLLLETKDAAIVEFEMWWGERILSVLSDPNIAFLLLMLGFYGLFFELYSPGWGVPGTVGAICIILAFFGLAVLPINYAGLLLIFLAIGLFVAEAFITSFGLLTLGGSVCLVLGGIMLVDSELPVMQVSLSVLIPVALGTGMVAFFLAGKALSSFRLNVQTGTEAMIGEMAIADEDFTPHNEHYRGRVLVHGELWQAACDRPISSGSELIVTSCEGLTLSVSDKADQTKRG